MGNLNVDPPNARVVIMGTPQNRLGTLPCAILSKFGLSRKSWFQLFNQRDTVQTQAGRPAGAEQPESQELTQSEFSRTEGQRRDVARYAQSGQQPQRQREPRYIQDEFSCLVALLRQAQQAQAMQWAAGGNQWMQAVYAVQLA